MNQNAGVGAEPVTSPATPQSVQAPALSPVPAEPASATLGGAAVDLRLTHSTYSPPAAEDKHGEDVCDEEGDFEEVESNEATEEGTTLPGAAGVPVARLRKRRRVARADAADPPRGNGRGGTW